jgi:NitT/TauT family transport system ATP-binding protein
MTTPGNAPASAVPAPPSPQKTPSAQKTPPRQKTPRELARLDRTSVVYKSKKGRVQALDAISLSLRANEVVALVGPSGCGKSTALRMIAGLLKPTTGTVEVGIKQHTRTLGGLSMMFQTPTLLDWRSVLGNVMLPLETRDISKAEARERSAHMLERVGLADFMHRRPYELSGGMQQRTAVARALVSEPEMLLLDEPFGALDAITRDQMCVELEGLVEERSMGVLLITHSIAEAILLGDRIVVMSGRPGSILEEIQVPLTKPRSIEDRISPAANEIESRLLRLLAVR